jgi:hypothetical protein
MAEATSRSILAMASLLVRDIPHRDFLVTVVQTRACPDFLREQSRFRSFRGIRRLTTVCRVQVGAPVRDSRVLAVDRIRDFPDQVVVRTSRFLALAHARIRACPLRAVVTSSSGSLASA